MAYVIPSAPGTTNYARIQQDEIDVLHSIFMEEFQEETSKTAAWNKTADRAFRLTLKPLSSEDRDHFATLKVSFPATYPKTSPKCIVQYGERVTSKSRARIEDVIKFTLLDSLGSEVIYELATAVQEALEDDVVASAHVDGLPALDEERAIQEHTAQKALEVEKAAKDKRQKDASEEEDRVLEEMMQKERARIAKHPKKTGKVLGAMDAGHPVAGGLTFDQEIKAKDLSGNLVAFRTVCDKTKLLQGPIGEVYTVRTTESEQNSTPYLALKQCFLTSNSSEEKLKKAVQALEGDLEKLIHLPEHVGIWKPFALHIQKSSLPSIVNGWTVSILTELATRGSLRNLLETIGKLDVANVRSWTIQIIEGLEFLHTHSIVHGRLHADNVLLQRTSAGNTVVKLSDALFEHEMHTIKRGREGSRFSSAISAYWIAPEIANKPEEKLTPPRDIWDLGLLMLQMLFGSEVQREYSSPDMLMESLDLSQSLQDLLFRVFQKSPRNRPTAFGLRPSEFLRNDDPILDVPLTPAISRVTSVSFPVQAKNSRARHDSTNIAAAPSRYANDFVESGRLGKGGFGEVVRARNRLDGRIYAIKKVSASSREALDNVISETILLSKMNHIYVVRYYTAWIESEGRPQVGDNVSDESVSESSESCLQSRSNVDFGYSNSGLDIMDSNDFPEVEFGYDSEEDRLSQAVEEDEETISDNGHTENYDQGPGDHHLAPSHPQRRRSSVSTRSTMYIQMEICERQTLRDLIVGELASNAEECWRLFRQILEGLVHVHGTGVIHRDLKPENVFIDEFNNVRIGDFGLARPGDYQAPSKIASTDITNPSMTRSIGTSFYVAPEVKSSGSGKYNEKADMYSLGIILFEMCYPLRTGMERAQILGRLRENNPHLPSSFDSAENATKKEIILSLVNHKVNERPSSAELLDSGKVPLQFEDETLRSAMQALSDPTAPLHKQFVAALFKGAGGAVSTAKDYTFDLEVGSKFGTNDLVIQRLVKDKLTAIFRHHGAVETPRPLLLPNSKLYSGTAVRLLNISGAMVHLPYDLTLPHARVLAKQESQETTARKSFAFGDVYREAPAGLHPRSHGEVDFDIVSYDSLDLALREAEVLKVVDEILDTFPSLSSELICYHINHSALLNYILTFCNIPEVKKDSVKDIISKLNMGGWTWTKIRNELRDPAIGVASTSLDELMRFDFRGPYEKAIPKLRTILQDTEELESVFRHLEAVNTYLNNFNVKRKVYINPLSSFNDRFYRGNLLFQCLYDGKKRDLLIAGGRYDNLVNEYRPSSKSGKLHAVGFNLGWEKICTSIVKHRKSSAKFLKKGEDDSVSSWTVRRCDVLVSSFDAAALRSTGIKIVQDLWANEISAELAIDTGNTGITGSQLGRDDANNHDWVVVIKQDDILKVRSMQRKEEIELRVSELVPWLRGELRDRDRLETKAVERTRLHHQFSYQESGPTSTEREPDVKVLKSMTKTKKSNRGNIVADAQLRARELAHSFLDGPIAAIETKDDVFEGLRDTRLSDPETWRKFIQNAPLAERAYLGDLHQMLRGMADDPKNGTRNAFVYNFRTRACIYYDLGRAP